MPAVNIKNFSYKNYYMAANKREIIGANEDERISDDKLFLKSVKKDTPFTNKLEQCQSASNTKSY